MCMLRHRYVDLTMGPLRDPLATEEGRRKVANRLVDHIRAEMPELRPLNDDELKRVREFEEERRKQLESEPTRGLRPSPSVGWQCPNCGGAHAPDVHSCPNPPRGGSLRERLKIAHNG